MPFQHAEEERAEFQLKVLIALRLVIFLGLKTKPVGWERVCTGRDDAISIASPGSLGLLSSFKRSFQRHSFASVEVKCLWRKNYRSMFCDESVRSGLKLGLWRGRRRRWWKLQVRVRLYFVSCWRVPVGPNRLRGRFYSSNYPPNFYQIYRFYLNSLNDTGSSELLF